MNVEELKRVADTLEARIYREICPLQIEAWITREPVLFADRTQGEHRQLKLGDPWSGELFDCAWFKFSAELPDDYVHANVYALLDINGEMLVVDPAGNPVEGLTNRASHFGTHLGMPGKVSYELPERGVKHVEIWADGALNDLFGSVKEDGGYAPSTGLDQRSDRLAQSLVIRRRDQTLKPGDLGRRPFFPQFATGHRTPFMEGPRTSGTR